MKKLCTAVLLLTLVFSFTTGAFASEKPTTASDTKNKVKVVRIEDLSPADSVILGVTILTKAGKYENALAIITKALNKGGNEKIFLDPRDESYAYSLKGYCEYYLLKLNEANNDFEIAIDLDKKNYEAYTGQVLAYSKLKEYARAAAVGEKAIAAGDTDSITYNNLAMSYMSMGKYDKALETVNIALEKEPKSLHASDTKGDILLHMGRAKEALGYFNTAIEIEKHPIHYFNRARCYEALHKTDLAIKDYEVVVGENGENASEAQMRLNALRK